MAAAAVVIAAVSVSRVRESWWRRAVAARDEAPVRRPPLAREHHPRVRRQRRHHLPAPPEPGQPPEPERPAPPEVEARQPQLVPVQPDNRQHLLEELAGAAPRRHPAFRVRLQAAPAEDSAAPPASCM